MTLDSVFFIGCFLPMSLLLHWLMPGIRTKNGLLLVVSLVFYAFSGLAALPVLAVGILIAWAAGVLLRKGKAKKWVLAVAVAIDLALLAVFKYADFLLTQVLGLQEASLGLAAPLGISYFLFKCIAYKVDVYRDEKQAGGFLEVALFVSFFPQITMGPITRFSEFLPQLKSRELTLETTAKGIRRFVVGLAKRLVISAPLGIVVDQVFATALPDARLAWLGAVCYCLQLYFDFSGFIDMVIGLGTMLGFTTRENFDHPYMAASIGDFWRRWHMSLSGWFKDYLYIPLGGNRKGSLRAGLNKSIVFILCGLWHGANWTFLLWGIWHGVLSLLESLQIIPTKKMAASRGGRVVGHIYALLAVCLGFVMFRAANVSQGFAMLGAMFAGFSFTDGGTVLHSLLNGQTLVMLALGVVLSLPVGTWLQRIPKAEKWLEPASFVLTVALFVLCLLRLASGNFAPSIYAQF